MTVGQWLKNIRLENGLTLQELATLMSIQYSGLSRWENEWKNITIKESYVKLMLLVLDNGKEYYQEKLDEYRKLLKENKK